MNQQPESAFMRNVLYGGQNLSTLLSQITPFESLQELTECRILRKIKCPDNRLRYRKVVSRSRTRATGKYPSWKMGRSLQWESHAELLAVVEGDFNPDVLAMYEQPMLVQYWGADGEVRSHAPDLLILRNSGYELIEIKHA